MGTAERREGPGLDLCPCLSLAACAGAQLAGQRAGAGTHTAALAGLEYAACDRQAPLVGLSLWRGRARPWVAARGRGLAISWPTHAEGAGEGHCSKGRLCGCLAAVVTSLSTACTR